MSGRSWCARDQTRKFERKRANSDPFFNVFDSELWSSGASRRLALRAAPLHHRSLNFRTASQGLFAGLAASQEQQQGSNPGTREVRDSTNDASQYGAEQEITDGTSVTGSFSPRKIVHSSKERREVDVDGLVQPPSRTDYKSTIAIAGMAQSSSSVVYSRPRTDENVSAATSHQSIAIRGVAKRKHQDHPASAIDSELLATDAKHGTKKPRKDAPMNRRTEGNQSGDQNQAKKPRNGRQQDEPLTVTETRQGSGPTSSSAVPAWNNGVDGNEDLPNKAQKQPRKNTSTYDHRGDRHEPPVIVDRPMAKELAPLSNASPSRPPSQGEDLLVAKKSKVPLEIRRSDDASAQAKERLKKSIPSKHEAILAKPASDGREAKAKTITITRASESGSQHISAVDALEEAWALIQAPLGKLM